MIECTKNSTFQQYIRKSARRNILGRYILHLIPSLPTRPRARSRKLRARPDNENRWGVAHVSPVRFSRFHEEKELWHETDAPSYFVAEGRLFCINRRVLPRGFGRGSASRLKYLRDNPPAGTPAALSRGLISSVLFRGPPTGFQVRHVAFYRRCACTRAFCEIAVTSYRWGLLRNFVDEGETVARYKLADSGRIDSTKRLSWILC